MFSGDFAADRRTAALAAAHASMRCPVPSVHKQPTGGLRPHAKGKCHRTGEHHSRARLHATGHKPGRAFRNQKIAIICLKFGVHTNDFELIAGFTCRRGVGLHVNYISTRGEAPPVSFTQMLLAGLAPDGGLYLPQAYPTVLRNPRWPALRANPTRRSHTPS